MKLLYKPALVISNDLILVNFPIQSISEIILNIAGPICNVDYILFKLIGVQCAVNEMGPDAKELILICFFAVTSDDFRLGFLNITQIFPK